MKLKIKAGKSAKLPEKRTTLPGKHDLRPIMYNLGSDGYLFQVACPECGGMALVRLDAEDAEKVVELYEHDGFHPAGHVQDVFPNWRPHVRERFLQSGLCPGCWKKLMGEPRED